LERIVFAVDYPFVGNEGAVPFLEKSGLPGEAKHMIAHRNAELLLGL